MTASKTSIQYPVTSNFPVARFFLTFTNALGAGFTGTTIFNFFPDTGHSQPLGAYAEPPGQISVFNPTVSLEPEEVTSFLLRPNLGVQNPAF